MDYRPLLAAVNPIVRRSKPLCLHVAENGSHFVPFVGLPTATPADILGMEQDDLPVARARDADLILLDLDAASVPHLGLLIEKLCPRLRPGGKIVAYYRHEDAAIDPGVSKIALGVLMSRRAAAEGTLSITFAGGEAKHRLHHDYLRVMSYAPGWRPKNIARAVVRVARLLLRAMRLNSRLAAIQDEGASITPWSSFLVTLKT
jgi:hypothetical protein